MSKREEKLWHLIKEWRSDVQGGTGYLNSESDGAVLSCADDLETVLTAADINPEDMVLVPIKANSAIRSALYQTKSGFGDDYMTPEEADFLWSKIVASAAGEQP